MKQFPVIGLAGRARVGKDSVAEMLLRIGAARYRYSFAAPIKAMLLAAFRIDMDGPDWAYRKEQAVPHLGVSPRRLAQTLGTEWGRQMIHPDIWVKEAQLHMMENGPGMVISDVRFDNEAEWVRLIGGKVIHITRTDAPVVRPHASENGVPTHDGDWHLDNSGTLAELRTRVAELFRGNA